MTLPLRYVANLSFYRDRVKVHRNDCETLRTPRGTRFVFDADDLADAVKRERARMRGRLDVLAGRPLPVTACRYCKQRELS